MMVGKISINFRIKFNNIQSKKFKGLRSNYSSNTISAIKTRPPASACGRMIAGESACGKGVKCRGGDGFLGGRIGTAEDGETARPRRCSRRHIRVSTTDENCTPNPTRHPRLTPAQPPINPRAVGADAFRLTLLRNRALRPYIWPLLFSNN